LGDWTLRHNLGIPCRMKKPESRSTIDVVAERLRTIVLEAPEDTLIGSEDALVAVLGCSRASVRQVARLLEREGLLKVRRGINGGYFGARPDVGVIERTVSAYLETLNIDAKDTAVLASALWVEAVRKAAMSDRAAAQELATRLKPRVAALPDHATFEQVRDIELLTQSEIFTLADSGYIKLIFDINFEFSRRRYPASPVEDDYTPEHREFVRLWREAKLQELGAIALGERELAVMAAQYSRKIWYRRIGRRFVSQANQDLPQVRSRAVGGGTEAS
jgi:DNA-binding FadR family transcriptional regulator